MNANIEQQSTSDDIIVIKDLNKWYGDFHVLKDINLSVKKSERIVLSLIHISEPTRPY